MARGVAGTKTGTTLLTANLTIEYAPVRPPLELVYDPEGIPLMAPGIGLGVARWVLRPRPSLRDSLPEMKGVGVSFEALPKLVSVDANTPDIYDSAPPRLVEPLATAGALEGPLPTPGPVYAEVYRLARVARDAPPDDRRFAQTALETASRVGMLYPGWGNPVAAWHGFAQETEFYLDLLRAFQEGAGLEMALHTLDPPAEPWMEVYRALLDAWRGVRDPSVEALARHLSTVALREMLPRLEVPPDGRIKARVSPRAWVRLELAQAFTERRVRFCPVCGAPFLGRADRETCRSDRCRKAWYRKKKKSKDFTAI